MELKTAAAGQGGYPWVDRFRIVAAFLVVAIHTSPLWTVSETADFVFTRVLARVAVPFFFMASGFFLAKSRAAHPLGGFVKKILLYYGVAILLYLPLNIYMGYFSQGHLPTVMLRDLIFNGTFYHLWYFPGVLLGAVIAWGLHRHAPPGLAFAVAGLLYLVGVGGDSYYGLAAQVPALGAGYDFLFTFFDYTRNGLFFAPLFVLMGMKLAAKRAQATHWRGYDIVGLCAALGAMLAEALLLRGAGVMRHDSMYLALPACLWFLFSLLTSARGAGSPAARRLSTLVFILHPWCIVLVRGAARLLRLQWLIVDISPVFYLCVSVASLLLALVLMQVPPLWKNRGVGKRRRTWAEVDEQALGHNLAQLRALLPPRGAVMAVVKADAYGHGAVRVARSLQRRGVRAFAVATMDEGIRLRRHGVRGVILVLGYTPPALAASLWRHRLTQTVVDAEHAAALAAQGLRLKVHLKVDSGMHRLGVDAADLQTVADIYALPHLRVEGIYTHLARADSLAPPDEAYTEGQITAFYALLEGLAQRGIKVGKTHLQSSHGLLNHPGLPCDYVRLGLALYGGLDGAETRAKADLRPVLALKTRVASLRTVEPGDWVGYGDAWQSGERALIATLAAGYADGIPRGMQGGRVLLNGCSVPVVGRVCMDQISVRVDGVPGLRQGDEAVLIGQSGGEEITVMELAGRCGTIPNEILAGLGGRVRRLRRREACPGARVEKVAGWRPMHAVRHV